MVQGANKISRPEANSLTDSTTSWNTTFGSMVRSPRTFSAKFLKVTVSPEEAVMTVLLRMRSRVYSSHAISSEVMMRRVASSSSTAEKSSHEAISYCVALLVEKIKVAEAAQSSAAALMLQEEAEAAE